MHRRIQADKRKNADGEFHVSVSPNNRNKLTDLDDNCAASFSDF
jgi:hypothetical protein